MRSPLLKAVLGALLVFALPIVTPHFNLPFGAALVMGWMDGRPALWLAAEAALAVLAHDIAFFMGWRYFRQPGKSRLMVYIGTFAVLWPAINWAYLVAIPQYFLTDSERRADLGDWPQECFLEGYFLPDVRTPADLSMERAGRTIVAQAATQEMAWLEMPGCKVTPLGLDWSNADPTIYGATASGAVLFSRNAASWHVLAAPKAEPIDVAPPPGAEHPSPILSTDGEWVAWLVRPPAVVLTEVSGRNTQFVSLQPFAPGSFRLDFLDMQTETLIVARNETEFLTLGLDGAERAPRWNPDWVKAWVGTVRRLDDGWVAWDAYQDEEPYRLAWALASGAGEQTAQRGYRISEAALEPTGELIAVSISGRYNFDMPDGIYVLRASNGDEVFRRSFPRFTRSRVAFPGRGFFAYAEGGGVRVLRTE